MTDRDACVVLNLISGVGHARLKVLIEAYGSPAAALTKSAADLAKLPSFGKTLAAAVASWRNSVDLDAEKRMIEKAGVRVATLFDDDYPSNLKEIPDPPLCLYVRGELPDLTNNSLAIVGTRRMTTYGRRMAERLSESAAFAGWVVVSGLAYGVDAVAHQACLDAGGKTVAVLGGGLARVQPQDHVPLARDITANGAVISEFPMEFTPTRRSFPMRNRIISGLSRATLVVEAGAKSGSLITADFALEQGRSVFAVPSQADNPQGRGCNSLIKQGAKLTETFEDILEDFEFLPGFAPVKTETGDDEEPAGESRNDPELTDNERLVADALSLEERNVDDVIAATELPAGAVLAALMGLEMKRVAIRSAGQRYALRR